MKLVQKAILIISAIIIFLMLIYPPYFIKTGDSGQIVLRAGYCFIFDMLVYNAQNYSLVFGSKKANIKDA